MFEALRLKKIAREAAPGWADEAIDLFGYNAESVIAEQIPHYRYPERYAFEFCLREIARRRAQTSASSPSLADRLIVWAKARRTAVVASDPVGQASR